MAASGHGARGTEPAAIEEADMGDGRGSRYRLAGFIPSALTAGALLFQGCLGAPDTPRAGTFAWKTYRNDAIGVSLEYPDAYQPYELESGVDVAFKLHGSPAIRLSLRSEADSRHHGLWAGSEPVADALFAGRQGKRYAYDHYDGPFGSPVLAFVIPHEGKFLALEFRTMNSDLDDVQRRILESVEVD